MNNSIFTKAVNLIFKNSSGKIVLIQKPNVSMLVWLLLTVANIFINEPVLRILAFGSIVVWSLLEIFQGVNYFRRLLGLVVLLTSLYGII